MASAVGRRSADALEPLQDNGLPVEVKPLVAALNELLARLSRSLELQRSFIADAAHELRTPLTAVSLQLQVAERARTGAEQAVAIAALKRGIERANRLVEQLLSLARSEPGSVEQQFAEVNLTDIAKQTLAERAATAEAGSVDLGLIGNAPILVMGDGAALATMLGNLLDNAIHFTPAGGSINVEVRADNGQVSMIVVDSGPGIPPEERERVFERFYRHEAAGVPGSGLGLAIVRRIAQRHRAAVTLDTGDNGQGLKVIVRFPSA